MELICVQSDNAYQATVWIYDCIAKQKADTPTEIHWFLNDVCSKDLRLDGCDDEYHFYESFPPTNHTRETDAETNETKLLQLVRRRTDDATKKTAIVIDSISTLSNESHSLLINGLVCEIYSSRRRNTRDSTMKLFLTLRENALFDDVALVKHLKYLANVWSTITKDTVLNKVKKPSGRIIKEIYEYNDSDRNVKFTLVKKARVAQSKRETVTDDNLCSFKLDLTEQEKEARNAVQLPYVRNSSDDDGKNMLETRIHYHPDESDDWDEEEPDNDLEFV